MSLSMLDRMRMRLSLKVDKAVLPSKNEDKLKGIDIRKEHALILEKKSQLPRSKRDLVVARYNTGGFNGE